MFTAGRSGLRPILLVRFTSVVSLSLPSSGRSFVLVSVYQNLVSAT
jgi:hypothetical protein